jgi:hypothetical protein
LFRWHGEVAPVSRLGILAANEHIQEGTAMICKEFAQELALAAAGCLDSTRRTELNRHCGQCAQCAARLQEFQQLALAHSKAAVEVEGLPCVYRHSARPGRAPSLGQARALLKRWRLPVSALAGLTAGFVWLMFSSVPAPPAIVPGPAAQPVAPALNAQSPSLGAYRHALNSSGEASLDALLSWHERHVLPKTPDQELRQLRRHL